jgi:hypothetical protein
LFVVEVYNYAHNHWLIVGITIFFALILGTFGFFTLLIGLNGVPESTGWAILLSYLVLLLLTILLAIQISRWSVTTITTRTDWSIWAIAPFTILSTTVMVAAILVLGSLVLIIAFGIT